MAKLSATEINGSLTLKQDINDNNGIVINSQDGDIKIGSEGDNLLISRKNGISLENTFNENQPNVTVDNRLCNSQFTLADFGLGDDSEYFVKDINIDIPTFLSYSYDDENNETKSINVGYYTKNYGINLNNVVIDENSYAYLYEARLKNGNTIIYSSYFILYDTCIRKVTGEDQFRKENTGTYRYQEIRNNYSIYLDEQKNLREVFYDGKKIGLVSLSNQSNLQLEIKLRKEFTKGSTSLKYQETTVKNPDCQTLEWPSLNSFTNPLPYDNKTSSSSPIKYSCEDRNIYFTITFSLLNSIELPIKLATNSNVLALSLDGAIHTQGPLHNVYSDGLSNETGVFIINYNNITYILLRESPSFAVDSTLGSNNTYIRCSANDGSLLLCIKNSSANDDSVDIDPSGISIRRLFS